MTKGGLKALEQREIWKTSAEKRRGSAMPSAGAGLRLDQLKSTAPKITAFIYSSQPTRV